MNGGIQKAERKISTGADHAPMDLGRLDHEVMEFPTNDQSAEAFYAGKGWSSGGKGSGWNGGKAVEVRPEPDAGASLAAALTI